MKPQFSVYPLHACPCFQAQAISSNQVMVTWDATLSSNSTTYVIERRSSQIGYDIIVSNVVDDLSFFDPNATVSSANYYRVRAKNYWGESAWTETSVITDGVTNSIPVTNAVVWFRADAGIVQQTTNTTVAAWLNQVSTNDASQITTSGTPYAMGNKQPIYVASETNGHPVLEFNVTSDTNGLNDYFALPSSTIATTPASAEVYVVLKAAVTSSTNQGFWDFGTGDANTHYPNSTAKIEDNFGSSFKRVAVTTTAGLDQYHLYQVITTTGAWTNRVNGTDVFVAAPNTVQFDSTQAIGKGGSFYFQGNIAEILIFTNVLSSSQNATVTNYLKNKYNLP